jgi:hypothetical protein
MGQVNAFAFARSDQSINKVALFSDGLERLLLDHRQKSAHAPFFDAMFSGLGSGSQRLLSEDLGRYLRSDRITERTDDDTALILAAREMPLL